MRAAFALFPLAPRAARADSLQELSGRGSARRGRDDHDAAASRSPAAIERFVPRSEEAA